MIRILTAALSAAFLTALGAITPLAAESKEGAQTVDVWIDQATIIKIPERVSSIVVGNPLIADVTVQPGSTLVVTGKGYGATNVVALDRAGNVLMEKAVRVGGPRDATVVVFRGVQRATYSCLPNCEPRITLGDGPTYFNDTIGQTVSRNGQAQGLAQPQGTP